MGRRSRARRAAQPPAAVSSAPAPRPARLTDERPKPPWHPVPLVELSVLVGIVLIVVGFVTGLDSGGGRLALLSGLVLASLGGLDTALREHFAGFRSHSSVLAGVPAGGVAGGGGFWGAPGGGGARGGGGGPPPGGFGGPPAPPPPPRGAPR